MAIQPDNRRRIGIRELRDHLSEVVREVRDEELSVDVTIHGQVVAELRPPRADPPRATPLVGRSGPRTDEQIQADQATWAEYRRQAQLPPRPVDPEKNRRREAALDLLAEHLRGSWPSGLSAVDLIREDRDAE